MRKNFLFWRIEQKRYDTRHRKKPRDSFAVMKIGDVLKNSVAVNELNGSATRKTEMSYMLLGACRDSENLYVVRSVVSKLENDVTEIDV